jgi:hypothetical protein
MAVVGMRQGPGMKGVEVYAQVRYAVQIEGRSRREAARRYGIDPRTVAQMLVFSVPPGYRRSQPPARPKLDRFTGIIDGILAEDERRPRKRRHTSKRILETAEAFCDGHNATFASFGGVPKSLLFDNTSLAVARILRDGVRQRTQVFSELQSHYVFADRFGRPGKGNDKGKVRG